MIQRVQPELERILNMPTKVGQVRQSVFRSNGILMHILKMVERGDSKETIWDVYAYLNETECEVDSASIVNEGVITVSEGEDTRLLTLGEDMTN